MNPFPFARILIGVIIWNATPGPALAECEESDSQGSSVNSTVIAEGLVYPWSVGFLATGDILVTERPGRLRVVREGILLDRPVQGLPRLVNLFDVAVHPDFSSNHMLFLAYSARDAGGVGLEVLRARLLGDRLVDSEIVFRATPKDTTSPLSGGRLLFLPDDTLMITVGDRRAGGSSGQDLSNHFGTIVRITGSGRVVDNDPPSRNSRLPEIYTFGHRNVQGIALDTKKDEVWISEHGPIGGDELNFIRHGRNYGWPLEHFGESEESSTATGVRPQDAFERPVLTWTPAIAPSGLAIYRGKRFEEWDGSMFIGSLTGCHLLRVRLSDDRKLLSEEKLLGELGAPIRDVRVGPDEAIYVLTDELDGKLIRIEPYDARKEAS